MGFLRDSTPTSIKNAIIEVVGYEKAHLIFEHADDIEDSMCDTCRRSFCLCECPPQKESLKPCIYCGKETGIYKLRLGDIFTLTYLRVCSDRCMFAIALDYIHEVSEFQNFRKHMCDKQNDKDKQSCQEMIEHFNKQDMQRFQEEIRKWFPGLTKPLNDKLKFTKNPEPKTIKFRRYKKLSYDDGEI